MSTAALSPTIDGQLLLPVPPQVAANISTGRVAGEYPYGDIRQAKGKALSQVTDLPDR